MKQTRFLSLLIALCLLTGLAMAEGCAICSGDAVCDTCGGLGYLEMKALTGEMVQVICIGGCTDGKCPDCTVACDVCGSDGLCNTCGGLGYLEMKAYQSDDMLQIACTGENCAAGKCAVCGAGDAVNTDDAAADVPQEYHTFAEPAVEAAVRKVLGKETGGITYAELLGVKKLSIRDTPVSTVEDIAYMTNLTELVLCNNGISDLAPLSGLHSLSILWLNDNNISDIHPLEGLIGLTSLALTNNNISDISALRNMTGLTELGCSDNRISDINPLRGLTGLETLELENNSISDISALQSLSNLKWLYLSYNRISDFSPIDGLGIDYSWFTYSQNKSRPDTAADDSTPNPTAAPKPQTPCSYCGGDGRCDRCGGSHYYYATEYVWQGLFGDGYELETFSKLCDYEYCTGGGCSMCDGTGWEP